MTGDNRQEVSLVSLVDATSNHNPTGWSKWRVMHSTEIIVDESIEGIAFCFGHKNTDTESAICFS